MGALTKFAVNGASHTVSAPADTSLLEVLRNDLGLTGTKYGCGEGMCGACTVLVNGEPTRSCLTPLSSIEGASVETIEGQERDGKLSPMQSAFLEHGAMQCGYCVPGMVMSATALLRKNPKATDEEIVDHMDGNVCRCCGYPQMLNAVRAALRSGS